MHRPLFGLLALLAAAPALAQDGQITLGTPVTFAAPAAITDYRPTSITLRKLPVAQILVEIVANSDASKVMTFEYPRDCGSFGSTDGKPNPPTCPARDTSTEIAALIDTIVSLNLSVTNLWRRVFTNLCADFPSRFPGGCTVQ